MDAELTDERRRVDRSALPQRISHKKKRGKCIFSRLEIRFLSPRRRRKRRRRAHRRGRPPKQTVMKTGQIKRPSEEGEAKK